MKTNEAANLRSVVELTEADRCARAANDRPARCVSGQVEVGIVRILFFAFVALSIAFAPYIVPLRQFSDDLVAHPQPYLAISIGTTVIGLALFVVVGIVSAIRSGRRMTDAEAQAYASASLRVPNYAFYRGYFRGKAAGQQVENSNSFRQIKNALRSGEWLRNADWRRFLLSFAAGLLWVFGGLGTAFVVGPPAVKLIVGTALIYLSVRLAWAFWRA